MLTLPKHVLQTHRPYESTPQLYYSYIIMQASSFSILQQSPKQNNPSNITDFINRLHEADDKQSFLNEVNSLDKQLYSYYAGQNYLANPVHEQLYQHIPKQATKVDVPKHNSLVDSMLRSTLGCEEKLATEYLKTLDQTKQTQQDQKNKRIQEAKNKFSSYNSRNDFEANTKAFMARTKFADQRPVIDNEHDTYLKTHLTFLNKPNAKTTPYYTKFADTVTTKIVELGGIQDTISPIEESLKLNEIKNVKKREKAELEVVAESKHRRLSPCPSFTNIKNDKSTESWLNESKMMRQTALAKLITS